MTGTIEAEKLAGWAGMPLEALGKAIRGECKPDAAGNYDADTACRAVIQHLARERDFISREELAELQEISGSRVSVQTREGLLEQDGQGRWPRRKTMHDLIRYYRGRIGEGKTTAGNLKTETLRLQNEILRNTVAQQQGKLIPVEQVEKGWAFIILRVRQAFLRFGNKMAPRIPYLKDAAAIEDELQKEADSILEDLSRPVEYRPDEPSDAETA